MTGRPARRAQIDEDIARMLAERERVYGLADGAQTADMAAHHRENAARLTGHIRRLEADLAALRF